MRRALLLLAFVAGPALAAEVAGVRVDDRARVEASELVLNGAGLRTKYFVNVYVAGLYLAQKKTSTADVLALPGAKLSMLGGWSGRGVTVTATAASLLVCAESVACSVMTNCVCLVPG